MPPVAPSLRDLQRDFARALASGAGAVLVPWIAARGIAPAGRLAVYRNAGLAIHVEALATGFPAVRALLGERAFDGLATRHAARVGSRSGNLQDYGADFPAFLAHQPELAGLPRLAEVARLERERQACALAAPQVAVDAAALIDTLTAAADPGLRLQPHLRLFASGAPVLDLWRRAFDPRQPVARCAQTVLLWRADGQVAMRALDPAPAAFVRALLAGRTLAAACAIAQAAAPVPAQELLEPLLRHALIAAITPREMLR